MWYGVLAVILLGLGAFGVFRFRVHDQLNRRIEGLRAQGMPMSLVQMNVWYRENYPEPAHNAWPVYASAFEACVSGGREDHETLHTFSDALHARRGQSLDPVELQKARAYLADNRACLALLYDAAKIEHCRQPLDFLQGVSMRLPGLHESRVCAMLLQLASNVAVQAGDIDQALKAIDAMFALAESLDEPVTIVNLARARIWRLGISTLEDVLSHQALTDEQITALAARLEPVASMENFWHCLKGDCCSMLAVFDDSPRRLSACFAHPKKGPRPLSFVLRKIVGLHDQDTLSYIHMMQAYIEAASLQQDKVLCALRTIEADHEHDLGILARELNPRYHRIYGGELRAVARALCARVGLAIEHYRQGHRQLPKTLDSLVPEYIPSVPLDPFDGQPLRFLHLDRGYVVYSVGQDLTDDGGKECETRTGFQDKAWDETFVVAR